MSQIWLCFRFYELLNRSFKYSNSWLKELLELPALKSVPQPISIHETLKN